MMHTLRDDRSGPGRRRGRDRLAQSLARLSDLQPRGGAARPRWGSFARPKLETPCEAPGDCTDDPSGVSAPDDPDRSVSDPVPSAPIRSGLTDDQKESILKYLSIGTGRYGACKHAGVSSRSLCEEMHADERFGQDVRDAEKVCVDDCKLVIYDQALSGSVAAAIAFCKLENDREAAEESLRQGREKLKIDKQVADGYTDQATVHLSRLTNEELAAFKALHRVIAGGYAILPDQSMEYCRLMRKVSGPGQFDGPSASQNALPGAAGPALPAAGSSDLSLQDVERLFGVDDNEAD